MTRTTERGLRGHGSDFRRWLRVDLDSGQAVELRLAISRYLQFALEGSTRSLSVLAKLKELGVF